MKRTIIVIAFLLCLCLPACSNPDINAQIAATTLPVWEFTNMLCNGTNIQVTRLITENVSCLHDYTLQVDQMRKLEAAEMVVISGAGLEGFLQDAFMPNQTVVDPSVNIPLLCTEQHHDHEHTHEHSSNHDPHIWLSPAYAKIMCQNICHALTLQYPQHKEIFSENLRTLENNFDSLISYAADTLTNLSCRELITFHDGFSYMAQAFDLHILHTIEEESGSEASAAELINLCTITREYKVPAIFTEKNGSSSAASVISSETSTPVYQLDMGLSNGSYFETMKNNIDTIKEALG